MVYWEDHSPRTPGRGRKYDAVVCANALYTLSLAEQQGFRPPNAGIIAATNAYVAEHLRSGRYLSGTRYYPAPEAFLYAVSRLCGAFPDHAARLGPALRREVLRTRCRQPQDALGLALWTAAADNAGADAGQDECRVTLARLQQANGAWPACAYYRMGRVAVYFGSPLITTLFAVRALRSDG